MIKMYTFLITLLSHFLSDKDILQSLLLVDKHTRSGLEGYRLKRIIPQFEISIWTEPARYLPLIITRVNNVTSLPVGCDTKWLTELALYYDFDHPIEVGDIPPSVTHLSFGMRFNQPMKLGSIPSSVTFDIKSSI